MTGKNTNIPFLTIVLSIILCCQGCTTGRAPDGMMIEFLKGKTVSGITDSRPEFGWIVHSSSKNDMQSAFRILVASELEMLYRDKADMWDSKKTSSASSINVSYRGKELISNRSYYWKVKTWCKLGGESKWSSPMMFTTGDITREYTTTRYALTKTEIPPSKIVEKDKGRYLIDFGKVAFGYLRLEMDSPGDQQMEVHFGERGNAEGIITDLGKTTVRYYKVVVSLKKGVNKLDIHPPVDKKNTGKKAIKLPAEFGAVTPFRYIELVNCPAQLKESMIRQVAIHYPFDETASSFESSDPVLNAIWDLCKYSMKATSFCGVYVDGERERIPYEADAYINQLSHYAVDREYSLARYSHEYLLEHPTWPIEWSQHSVLMAWADYMYTGNTESLVQNYDVLKKQKTQEFRAREDGLLDTGKHNERGRPRVVLDWPRTERDGYQIKEVNNVVNAFYYQTLLQMSEMAAVLGKDADAAEYLNKAAKIKTVFNKVFFDADRKLYVDAEGTDHVSLHGNMMPLAFGLVPQEHQKAVADYVVSRGMACSVYGAQYLMEALYNAGRGNEAFDLLVSKDIRSWYNMIRVGSTITLEAWDDSFKPNQDWNHAWGAVPGNIIPRFLLGVRPLEAGFSKVLIRPMPGRLEHAESKIPTIRGPIEVNIRNEDGKTFELTISIPANMTARVEVPLPEGIGEITVDGRSVKSNKVNGFAVIDNVGSGRHQFRTTAVVKK